MELKIWCERCKGSGKNSNRNVINCPHCKGKGYTTPPQEVLDDLECVEIERYLNAVSFVTIVRYAGEYRIEVRPMDHNKRTINAANENKLEALRKAKEWIDQKGGE